MAKERSQAPLDPTQMSRRRQIIETYKMSRETDPRIGWWMLGTFLLAGAVGYGLFWLLPPNGGVFSIIISVVGAVLLGLLGMTIVFGRRAQSAAYKRLDGQLGAGARALTMLRKGWTLHEMIAFTKQQDMLHRVVGPPGIVLVAEGNPHRLKQLMTSEHKKHERVASEVPIHEVYVGSGEGEVPVSKLVRHVQKLGRQVKPAEITDVLNRLKALYASRPRIPMPRGPVPTSMKGMRGQMRGR